MTEHSPNGLKMYVPKDGIIYRKEVYQLCAVQPADGPAQHSPLRVDDGGDTDDHDGDTDGLESSTDSMRHSHGNPGVPSAIEAGDDLSSHAELMSSAESECESLDENFSTSSDHHHQPELALRGAQLVCVCADSLSLSFPQDAAELTWHPVIILVPVRLGIQCLNPIYIPTLKAFFSFPQCLGVIGGKPHSSFYFVGYQGTLALPFSLSLSFSFSFFLFHVTVSLFAFAACSHPLLVVGCRTQTTKCCTWTPTLSSRR